MDEHMCGGKQIIFYLLFYTLFYLNLTYIRVETVRELTEEEIADIKADTLINDEKAKASYEKMQHYSELIKATRNKVSFLFI